MLALAVDSRDTNNVHVVSYNTLAAEIKVE
jgi:hypothetical protein